MARLADAPKAQRRSTHDEWMALVAQAEVDGTAEPAHEPDEFIEASPKVQAQFKALLDLAPVRYPHIVSRERELAVVTPKVRCLIERVVSPEMTKALRIGGDPRQAEGAALARQLQTILASHSRRARRQSRHQVSRPKRGRARRQACNQRARGSRRVTSRSAGGGSSGDSDSDEPPGLAARGRLTSGRA